jgi:putative transposase
VGSGPWTSFFTRTAPGQYASEQVTKFAQAKGITRSMSNTGVCWENAMAERFCATLKTEF